MRVVRSGGKNHILALLEPLSSAAGSDGTQFAPIEWPPVVARCTEGIAQKGDHAGIDAVEKQSRPNRLGWGGRKVLGREESGASAETTGCYRLDVVGHDVVDTGVEA